ncbi:MAG: hypothetical protein H0V17_13875 [Deltaproteobacteria bacterium]|nr:hypothetical protein [Deltaproteobacteria bacterium]
MKQLLLVCSLLAMTSSALADKKPYTLADLKTLVSQKSYKEATEHLTDVAPSERTAEWLAVAADAATGYIAGLNNDDLVKKILEIERVDSEFPMLLKSPKYSKARMEIGLKGFEACFNHPYLHKECFEHGIKFIDADAPNGDLALRMAKLVRRNTSPAAGAAGYFKRAIDAAGKNLDAVCRDEDLKLVVKTGFNVPSHYEDAKTVRSIAGGACWSQLRKTVLDEYTVAGETSYERRNTCEVLKAQKALSAAQAKACERAQQD